VGAEAQLSAQRPAPPWELIGAIGTVIMVTGTDIIFIIGTTVVAGSVHRMEDHMWCRLDIADDACGGPFVHSPTRLQATVGAFCWVSRMIE
jgi:hypothetical protein